MFYYLSARPVIRNGKIFAQKKPAVGVRRSGMNISACCRMPLRSHGFIELTVRLILSYARAKKALKSKDKTRNHLLFAKSCYVQLNINFQ